MIRISQLEKIFDKALDIIGRANECPEEFLAYQGEIRKLEKYYTGKYWKRISGLMRKENYLLNSKGVLFLKTGYIISLKEIRNS